MKRSGYHIARMGMILLIFMFFRYSSGQDEWSGAIRISSGQNPDMVIDRKTGCLHVVSMYGGVIYVKKDSTGKDLIREMVTGSQGDLGEYHFGAAVAVDGFGNPHVCFRQYDHNADTYDLYYTWRDTVDWLLPFKISQDVPRGYVVKMAVDGQNRVHIAQSSESEKFLAPWGNVTYYRIKNGLRDKNEMITNPEIKNYRVDNRFEIDASGDDIVTLIIGNPDLSHGQVLYFRSNDGGESWKFITDIHNSQTDQRNGSPDVFFDLVGNTHFCYGAKRDFGVGGAPSVRYVCYRGNFLMKNIPVNNSWELESWHYGEGWGLGSVASTDDGSYVAVAYLTKDEGELYVRISSNGGTNWSDHTQISSSAGGFEGRSTHLLRAYRNHFYLVYPNTESGTQLRFLRNVGDFPPVAVAGGPYSGTEGDTLFLEMSASYDEGLYPGIAEYAWNWDGDTLYDLITNTSSVEVMFPDDLDITAVLRITDRVGQTSYDTAHITIVNAPPSVDIGENRSCFEGDTLTFSAQIFDPGLIDTHLVTWNIGDSLWEDILDVSYFFRDEGLDSVFITVTDKDGGIAEDMITVSVANEPPVAEAGGPYHAALMDTVDFFGDAWDPGLDDSLTFVWDLDDDGVFESPGRNVSTFYQENGIFKVRLKVTDEDGGIGIDSAEAIISNHSPLIGLIPDQMIHEGELFEPIALDDFVDDLEQDDDELTWSFSGNTELIITLENRILTASTPDSNWFGEELLTLTVEDPFQEKDSTEVTFTVLPVNDAPYWVTAPDTHFVEDDTLHLTMDILQTYITDVDDGPNGLLFSIQENHSIQWAFDPVNRSLSLFSPSDWNGSEILRFVVTDTSGASADTLAEVIIHPDPDSPDPFTLVFPRDTTFLNWPDSLTFLWHTATDPDSGDLVYYIWTLNNAGGSMGPITRTSNSLQDTAYVFYPDTLLEDGVYLWWVTAFDILGHSRTTDPRGIFVGVSDVETPEEALPDEFSLHQNYPNPFNPETRITYSLPRLSEIQLVVYNTLGQKVRILEQGRKPAGIHTVTWDGRDWSGRKVVSGIYICRLQAEGLVFHRKMMLLQ